MPTTLVKPETRTDLARDPLSRWFNRDLQWMRQLTRDFDRIFGDVGLRPLTFDRSLTEMTWMPELEVFERDGRFIVRADLPGLKKEDVKISVRDAILIIEGERKVEEDVKKDGFHRTERTYGTFFRSLTLPEGVKLDKAEATFKDGVLEVMMAMDVGTKPTQNIEVKVQ